MKRIGTLALAAGLAAGVAAALASPATADQWEKSFTVTGKPELKVETGDGSVRVTTWDKRQVAVRIETEGWEIGENGVRVGATQRGNHIEVWARLPHMEWSFGWSRRSLRVTVTVPRETDATVHTGDGDVLLDPLTGDLEVETGDGSITIEDLVGSARLHTGDGRIDVRNITGGLEAESGDGEVRARGRFSALDLRTGDGNVEVRVARGASASSGWSVTTGDGGLVLALPADFRATLDAHSGDGGIHVDLPVTVNGTIGHSTLRGSINGGGPTLTLRTGDGPIRIERSD